MSVYVITGANRGLGLEFVSQLSKSSSNTIIATTRSLSRDLSELEALQKQAAKLHILECDTGNPSSIDAFASKLASVLDGAKIDFLINNAGINSVPEQNALTLEMDGLGEQISVNVFGPAKTVQALVGLLGKGSVVLNMSSGMGSMTYLSSMENLGSTTYCISKAALNMLTVHQAKALKSKGIAVISMDPGWVKTDMGGSNAMLEKEESIGGMLKVLSGVTIGDSGKFYEYNGNLRGW